MADTARKYVSRAGSKLEHALREFDLAVDGLTCADFGCNVGGFTDCLLRHGAARVYAIDTGYGTLAYTLRSDDRVEVRERTNALHATPPEAGVDLVVIDVAWTRQHLVIPAALVWLKDDGRIVTLVKPHYEATDEDAAVQLVKGRLDPADAETVLQRVLRQLPELGVEVRAHTRSPLTGAKSGQNVEYLVLLDRGA